MDLVILSHYCPPWLRLWFSMGYTHVLVRNPGKSSNGNRELLKNIKQQVSQ